MSQAVWNSTQQTLCGALLRQLASGDHSQEAEAEAGLQHMLFSLCAAMPKAGALLVYLEARVVLEDQLEADAKGSSTSVPSDSLPQQDELVPESRLQPTHRISDPTAVTKLVQWFTRAWKLWPLADVDGTFACSGCLLLAKTFLTLCTAAHTNPSGQMLPALLGAMSCFSPLTIWQCVLVTITDDAVDTFVGHCADVSEVDTVSSQSSVLDLLPISSAVDSSVFRGLLRFMADNHSKRSPLYCAAVELALSIDSRRESVLDGLSKLQRLSSHFEELLDDFPPSPLMLTAPIMEMGTYLMGQTHRGVTTAAPEENDRVVSSPACLVRLFRKLCHLAQAARENNTMLASKHHAHGNLDQSHAAHTRARPGRRTAHKHTAHASTNTVPFRARPAFFSWDDSGAIILRNRQRELEREQKGTSSGTAASRGDHYHQPSHSPHTSVSPRVRLSPRLQVSPLGSGRAGSRSPTPPTSREKTASDHSVTSPAPLDRGSNSPRAKRGASASGRRPAAPTVKTTREYNPNKYRFLRPGSVVAMVDNMWLQADPQPERLVPVHGAAGAGAPLLISQLDNIDDEKSEHVEVLTSLLPGYLRLTTRTLEWSLVPFGQAPDAIASEPMMHHQPSNASFSRTSSSSANANGKTQSPTWSSNSAAPAQQVPSAPSSSASSAASSPPSEVSMNGPSDVDDLIHDVVRRQLTGNHGKDSLIVWALKRIKRLTCGRVTSRSNPARGKLRRAGSAPNAAHIGHAKHGPVSNGDADHRPPLSSMSGPDAHSPALRAGTAPRQSPTERGYDAGANVYYVAIHYADSVFKLFPFQRGEIQPFVRALSDISGVKPFSHKNFVQSVLEESVQRLRTRILHDLLKRESPWIRNTHPLQRVLHSLTHPSQSQRAVDLELLFHSCRVNRAVLSETLKLLMIRWSQTRNEHVHLKVLVVLDRLLHQSVTSPQDDNFRTILIWIKQLEGQLDPYRDPRAVKILSRIRKKVDTIKQLRLPALNPSKIRQTFSGLDKYVAFTEQHLLTQPQTITRSASNDTPLV